MSQLTKELIPYRIGRGAIPTLVNKTGSWRFYTPVVREKISPCTAACPLGNAIARWMERVKEGDLAGAWDILSLYNPFPLLTGTVCHHFCENECSRGQYDGPVTIRQLEKEVGLWRHAQPPVKPGKNMSRSVAVVGSGPAGLTCAYYLALMGAAVTVYERNPVIGGLLAVGIPAHRLDRGILAKELSILGALGVEFRTGTYIGKDITLQEIRAKYDAVYLATGTQKEKKLSIEGEDLPGVSGAVEYLRSVHLGQAAGTPRTVVVIGGGNAALDAACMARLGGADVYLAYRRGEDVMPAYPAELTMAKEMGICFLFETMPRQILGSACVEGIRMFRTESSRRGEEIEAVPGSAFTLPCEMVLIAAGQESDLSFDKDAAGLLSENLENGEKGIFAGGDLQRGASNIPSAIAEGRRGARDVASFLGIYSHAQLDQWIAPVSDDREVVRYDMLNPEAFPYHIMESGSVPAAARCFSCGMCSRCGVCWAFCPDAAVDFVDNKPCVALDFCKGCGICIRECPGGVLEMEVPVDGTESD